MPAIKKDFIKNRLIPGIDVVKLVNQFVNLKKSGADYTCCCPFHNEKTPSFHVNPRKQTFTCYGCGEWGNALDFVMKFKNMGFVDAVEELSRYAGMEVEYEEGSNRSFDREKANKKAYELMDRVASYFTSALNNNPEAMKYFTEQRGLSPELITRARLGYAPEDWDYVARDIARDESEYRELVDLGIQVDRNEDGRRVRRAFFRGRVMFPIFDIKGRIIAFGGRVFNHDYGPKYLNSPETKIFKKRRELFGIYETLQATRNRPEKVVVVEGYMDAIALRQAGFDNIVATLGTAITAEHLTTLFRYTGRVVCCFDGDEAGKKATWRALQAVTPVLEKSDKEVSFINMPAGHDPDTLVRAEGKEAFEREIRMAVSYSESIILHESKVYDISDPNQRANFITRMLSIIKAMKSFSLRLVTMQIMSTYVGVDTATLSEQLKDESLAPAQEFLGMDGGYSRSSESGRRYMRDGRSRYGSSSGHSSLGSYRHWGGPGGPGSSMGGDGQFHAHDDSLYGNEGGSYAQGSGGHARRSAMGAQGGYSRGGQGGAYNGRSGGYNRSYGSQSRHNWEQECSQAQSRQRSQTTAGYRADGGAAGAAGSGAAGQGAPGWQGQSMGVPSAGSAMGSQPGPFMMSGQGAPQSYAQAQQMGVSTDPAGRPYMPGMGMQTAAAVQGPDQHQLNSGPWGREVFYQPAPGSQGRPVSAHDVVASVVAEQAARMQHTPAAGYMQLGPDGMPAASPGRINAPEGYTGEYYEGGYGPGDDMMGGPGPDMDYDIESGPGGGYSPSSGLAGPGSQTGMVSAGGQSRRPGQGVRSILGREFEINELNAPCYRLMSFILQYPTVVASVYEELQVERMLFFVRDLKVDDYPLIEELIKNIRDNPTITCASMIENYRDTDLQEVVDLLCDCSLLPQREDGQEPPFEEKREFFSRTVFEMLQRPFRERYEYLNNTRGRQMGAEDMLEITSLASIVNRKFGSSS